MKIDVYVSLMARLSVYFGGFPPAFSHRWHNGDCCQYFRFDIFVTKNKIKHPTLFT